MGDEKREIEIKSREKYKILFVDDEIAILNSIRRSLYGKKFNVLFTDSAEKALSILEKEPDIGLVISDLKMPEMNGIQFLRIVNSCYPNIIKIVLTGNSQIPNILATVNESKIYKYLVKPWKLHEEFIPTLTEALYLYHMNLMREELLNQKKEIVTEEKGGFKLDEEQIKYFENLLELLDHSSTDIELIHKVAQRLPYFDKSNLEKLSLDIYSRSGHIHSSLASVVNVVESIIKKAKGSNDL